MQRGLDHLFALEGDDTHDCLGGANDPSDSVYVEFMHYAGLRGANFDVGQSVLRRDHTLDELAHTCRFTACCDEWT